MEAHSTATPMYPRPRWPWVVGAVIALVVVGAAIWYFAIRDTSESSTVHGPSSAPFTITRPSGWEALSQDQVAALPGTPLAALRRSDGNGIVVINVEPRSGGKLSQLSTRLESRLSKRIPDFELVSARTVKVKAGSALSISYARTKRGTSNTLLVVPAGGRTFSLSAVVPAGQKDAAKQAGTILSSFDD